MTDFRGGARSAASIVEEVSDLVTGHGVHTISFVDDDFLGGDGRGRERAFEFAELLRRREHQIKFSIECRINELDDGVLSTLREVGIRHVLIGVESANDTDIALFAKKTTNDEAERAIRLLRALDIDFSTGFIMFQPLSELDGIRTNLAFLARNRIGTHRRIANRLELYPGAPLTTYFQRRGVAFHEDRYRLYYDFENPGVAVLYSAFQEVLRPFESVEFEAQKALFEAATSPCGEDIARAHALKAVLDDIAGALVTAAFTCLEAVQAEEDPRSAEGIGAGVRRDCAELTERVRRIAGRREGTKEGRSHVGHGQ
ncbi:B12-binding domain-containing radical SAM protein [Actinomadura meyerae]|uniref:B12-binding domain-containing radical SAM protein n=1 Tax=Actinomadura meyerae TaxID=240840 RepID=UPI000B77177F|nr:radical SAM protein [Actinomadura meyerae]